LSSGFLSLPNNFEKNDMLALLWKDRRAQKRRRLLKIIDRKRTY